MNTSKPWLMVVLALSVLALAQLACGGTGGDVELPAAVRGGGWIPSGEGKATFGFQITCDEDTGTIKGQFQYNDRAQGVAFHGVVNDERADCRVPGDEVSYQGEYRPQPKNLGDPGDMLVELVGEDCLSVKLTGGAHDGYEHSGCLEGGNINVWLGSD